MRKYVDLHCHCIPGVDDGARSIDDTVLMLDGLGQLGFAEVVATPHIRPGMFDNDANRLRTAFAEVSRTLAARTDLPLLSLGAEHYFDDVVFARILADQAVPYDKGEAILLEFYDSKFPHLVDQRLAELCRKGLTPVIAHPERYRQLEQNPDTLERLLDLGAAALLDVAALVGKYGRNANRAAVKFLELGYYRAACSDAHGPRDVPDVARGIEWIQRHYGDDELEELLVTGPRALLAGTGRIRA
jgi:protein-tyrosine phosphatase